MPFRSEMRLEMHQCAQKCTLCDRVLSRSSCTACVLRGGAPELPGPSSVGTAHRRRPQTQPTVEARASAPSMPGFVQPRMTCVIHCHRSAHAVSARFPM